MLIDIWAVVTSHPNVRPVLSCAQSGDFPISVPSADCWLQPEGDLGARIESILCRGLTQAPAALAIGADTPLLTSDHLTAALSSLENSDAVLGPAADGGFYLLGLSRCPAGLLSGLAWSTCETAAVTRNRLRSESFRVAEIPELFDVDTVEDVRALANTLALLPVDAPATRRWLERYFRYAR